MSIKVMALVWDHSEHKGSALLMMLALADFADEQGGNIFPSVATLAHKCRMTERNVQLLLHQLAESGEITITTSGGRRGTNRYRILTAVLAQKPTKILREKISRDRNSAQKIDAELRGGVIGASPDPSVNRQEEPPEERVRVTSEKLARIFGTRR